MSKKLRVGILEGDDIGHEIVPVAVEVSKAAAKLHQVGYRVGAIANWTSCT
jgi:3-isopropylmalate dehydrogenase